jgi:hypothetical protein
MPARTEDVAAVRREIIDLLRQQMEALDSPLGLTDTRLMECYERQARVRELREKLQAATTAEPEAASTSSRETSTVARTSYLRHRFVGHNPRGVSVNTAASSEDLSASSPQRLNH